ncbi:MAG: ABC transporter permease [Clostridia bacterium]|jgi:ABC-2 type transport system permease protein
MFSHIFKYRLRCILRDRQMMFWTLLFPIILATLFNMAFSNLSKSELFSKIKIAVVTTPEYDENTAFKEAIAAVSNSQIGEDRNKLFDVIYTSEEEGAQLLDEGEIEGYILLEDDIQLVVKESGLEETIIKGFIDDFKQSSATIERIVSRNDDAIQEGLLDDLVNRRSYLKEIQSGRSDPDITVNYFYTLIAMACLYGGFLGLKEVTAIQADLSPQGLRVNNAPTHKLKIFIVAMLAATVIQLFVIFVLLAYLMLVLKVNFGGQLGYIIIACTVGTLTGVTFGAFIASIVKGGEGIKIGILIGASMTMSFLSGMMYDKMKYIISTNIPILGYLNPANLITDCFYSLYFYHTYSQFYTNIAILCGFILLFSTGTYFILRRQKHASL